jgi:aminomethyltransferase
MPRRTVLHDAHVAAGARIVDFHGWDMPLHYGSQLEEHHAVRADAGLFDVSHMTVVDIDGPAAGDWLRRLVANDPARLEAPGRALYTAMCDERGGILDDLIVYRRDGSWRLVVNSATRDKDLQWMESHRSEGVTITERPELAMLAVQGPKALERARGWLGAVAADVEALDAFAFLEDGERFVARTGYTGEDGFEVILPESEAVAAFETLLAAGVRPAGLGARDTLRLEAGMNLYGQDMLVGVVLTERGVLRAGQRVRDGEQDFGTLTSGAYSPTLGCGIGLARVQASTLKSIGIGGTVVVDIRGKPVAAKLVRPPFVRNGESRIG